MIDDQPVTICVLSDEDDLNLQHAAAKAYVRQRAAEFGAECMKRALLPADYVALDERLAPVFARMDAQHEVGMEQMRAAREGKQLEMH